MINTSKFKHSGTFRSTFTVGAPSPREHLPPGSTFPQEHSHWEHLFGTVLNTYDTTLSKATKILTLVD